MMRPAESTTTAPTGISSAVLASAASTSARRIAGRSATVMGRAYDSGVRRPPRAVHPMSSRAARRISLYSMRVHVADHPLVTHKLSVLRDARTPSPVFRQLTEELVTLLAYEATRSVRVEKIEIQT